MSNSLQHKIYHYEAKPPEQVWGKIEDALDHQDHAVASQLAAFEATPPANAWDKISQSLHADAADQGQPKGVVRRSNFLRYAVAASVVLLITVGLIWKFSHNEARQKIAVEKTGTTNTNTIVKAPETVPFTNNTVAATTTESKKTAVPNQTSASIQKEKSSDRYLTMADDDGNKVRLSKKVMSVFDCAENVTAANSSRCKENIKSLQQKMSASLVSPSGDFAGLVDMIKSLEENN